MHINRRRVITNIVLFGNPNVGKTTLFNRLTGKHSWVGNWPGVTVEGKCGYCVSQDNDCYIQVVDLPGCYTIHHDISQQAQDEHITYQYLTQTFNREKDIIINIIDATHLTRSLYLTLQLLEMQLPCIVAVSMVDVVEKKGIQLNFDKLSKQLGCPVIPLSVSKRHTLCSLKASIEQMVAQRPHQIMSPERVTRLIKSQPGIVLAHQQLMQELAHLKESQVLTWPNDWVALRLLDGDTSITKQLPNVLQAKVKAILKSIEQTYDEPADILIADCRYRLIRHIIAHVKQHSIVVDQKICMNATLDRWVLNRWLAIPLFFIVIYLIFWFSIEVAGSLQQLFNVVSHLMFVDGVASLLQHSHTPIWLITLLADGLGLGINTIMTFLPVLAGIFFFLGLIEDSGYMGRIAFIMDRLMRFLGLPGKAFVPLMIGFGCNVPAVMASRTLDRANDRLLTVLITPFMSCSARLSVYTVFCSAFFVNNAHNIVFILYLIGISMAVLTGLLLRYTVLRNQQSSFVMELPPYHYPQLNDIMRYTWRKLWGFVRRMSRLLIPVCMLFALLNTITVKHNNHSVLLLYQAGKFVTPIFKPMGIESNNWPATIGLFSGILAKEVVIGSLNILYSTETPLKQREAFSWLNARMQIYHALPWVTDNIASPGARPLGKKALGNMVKKFGDSKAAFAYLLFVLLYVPCLSTVSVTMKEIGQSWGWFSLTWSTTLAYATAVIYYQSATFALHPTQSFVWIGAMISLLVLMWCALHRIVQTCK